MVGYWHWNTAAGCWTLLGGSGHQLPTRQPHGKETMCVVCDGVEAYYVPGYPPRPSLAGHGCGWWRFTWPAQPPAPRRRGWRALARLLARLGLAWCCGLTAGGAVGLPLLVLPKMPPWLPLIAAIAAGLGAGKLFSRFFAKRAKRVLQNNPEAD